MKARQKAPQVKHESQQKDESTCNTMKSKIIKTLHIVDLQKKKLEIRTWSS